MENCFHEHEGTVTEKALLSIAASLKRLADANCASAGKSIDPSDYINAKDPGPAIREAQERVGGATANLYLDPTEYPFSRAL